MSISVPEEVSADMRNVFTPIRRCTALVITGLAMVLAATGAAHSGTLPLNILLQVDSSLDSDQYDFALTPGAAHVVYQKGGNVYYAYATKDNLTWTTVNLGQGNWPTIASDNQGHVMIAYANGQTIYGIEVHNGLTANPILTGVSGGKPVLSSPFFTPGWQMSVEGNFDGDSYTEVARLTNFGGGWSQPEILLDGWYDSGQGNYYAQSSIAAFADHSYALAYQFSNWGGNVNWSDKSAVVSGPGTHSIAKSTNWYGAIQISRRAVHCIANDGSAKAVFAFAIGNSIYVALDEGSGWSWLIDGNITGSAPAVSWKGGTYVDTSGVLHFISSEDEGQLSDDTLWYQNQALSGSNPLVSAMDDKFFLFKDPNNNLMFGAKFADVVPEPGSIMTLFTGMACVIGLARIRRPSK